MILALLLAAQCFGYQPVAVDTGPITNELLDISRELKRQSIVDGGTIKNNLTVSSSAYVNGNIRASGTGQFSEAIVPGLWAQQTSSYTSAYFAPSHPATPRDDSIPQLPEMAQLISSTITAKAASSVFLIEATVNILENSNITNNAALAVFKDTGAGAICATDLVTTAGHTAPMILRCQIAAGDVSAHVFNLRWGGDVANAIAINGIGAGRVYGGVAWSGMTITEIRQ